MKKIFIAILLLLIATSGLQAQKFKVVKPDKLTGPPGWTERTDKRAANAKVFQSPTDSLKRTAVVGLAPVHYLDTLAGWVEIDYAAADTAGLFNKVIRRGGKKMDIYYSTTKPGAMKFARRSGWLEYVPAFDTTQVEIELNISDNGLKENIYLNETSPNRLAWSYDYTSNHEKEAKGKGRIKNILNQSVAELAAMVAWDALMKPVTLTVTYTADSLIVTVDTAGVTWPITVDPTVNDTSLVTPKSGEVRASGASWLAVRGATSGTATFPLTDQQQVAYYNNFTLSRLFFSWYMGDLDVATSINSVTLHMSQLNGPTAPDSMFLVPVQGTFSGDTAVARFNDIENWQTGTTAYTPTQWVDAPYFVYLAGGSGDKSIALNAAGEAAVMTAMGSAADTLRMAILDKRDIAGTSPAGTNTYVGFTFTGGARPWMVIDYESTPATTSHVTTGSALYDDTLKVIGLAPQLVLFNKYDSSGTGGLDSVGVRLHIKGTPADSFFFADDSMATGGIVSFWSEADSVFSITTSLVAADTLLPDTLYIATAFSVSDGARIYSGQTARDTISTYITASSAATSLSATTFVVVDLGGNISFPYLSNTTPITVRGIEYYIKGVAETDTSLSAGGPFNAGMFSVSTTVSADTLYYFRTIFTDLLGDHVSALDSISTTQTGGDIAVPIEVMGVQGTVVNY